MICWLHRDHVTGELDICTDFTDSVGPDFAEVELDDEFVRSFSECQLAWAQFQNYAEQLWEKGEKQ
jgi:hypothetical protein